MLFNQMRDKALSQKNIVASWNRIMRAYNCHDDVNQIRKFDSMIRFHDAAIFRHLGVTR